MRVESDVIKTAVIVVALVGVYGGVVFWPSQKQNQTLAAEVDEKQAELDQMARPNLEPVRREIVSLRAELRERSVELPKGDLDERVLQHVSDTLIRRGITLYETSYRQTEAYRRFSMTPIDVSFQADFVDAFEIVRAIENEGPPVRVERLAITGGDAERNGGQVRVTLELSSFFEPAALQGGP